jgi:acetyltransferase-like isoleucine patch superfamily enzyme
MKEYLKAMRRRWRAYRRRPKIIYPHGDVRRGSLSVGERTSIAAGVCFDCTGDVVIGKHCVIAEGVRIFTHSHDFLIGEVPDITAETGIAFSSIEIGDNVYVGHESVILPKVSSIGSSAIIGARAVVTKDVPPGEIWAGNPARKIGERSGGLEAGNTGEGG